MTKMTIGNRLRKARQDKQVTTNEIYQQTRIHPNILTALEEDKFDNIPSPIYIRSFLKEYASYLGLDSKKLLEEYSNLHSREESNAAETSIGKGESYFSNINIEKLLNMGKAVLALILTAIVLIFFVKAAALIVKKISHKKVLETKQAKIDNTVKPQEVKNLTPSAAKARANPKEPDIKASPAILKEASIPAGETLRLSVKTADDVWMELKVDGKIIFKNVLKKGSFETWQARNNFKIWTGNAAAMQLSLNGNDLGAPGKGVMKDILITREGIKR